MTRLYPLVFTSGFVTLGMELSASRLLEPAFGNNQIIWSVLIGLILAYLAIGSWVGGKLADRFASLEGLRVVALLAAVGVALVPLISGPILRAAALGMDNFEVASLLGSLFAVVMLFSVPGVLLGAISPWAVRLSVENVAETGQIAGRLYATATVGSILGTFFPVLWLIPRYGTRWTFTLLALLLLSVIILTGVKLRSSWLAAAVFALVLGHALWSDSHGTIRTGWDDGAAGEILYEDESQYNYISVRQWGGERHLKLNDGIGIHSVYHPDSVLSLGIWDYFLVAPYFNPPAGNAPPTPKNVLIIGLAAGTVSELMTRIYGPIPITGIELDRQIIEVGQRFFDMNQPNLTPVAADGRAWLAQQPPDALWDMVAVDAYRPPYIPFHLTTVEFFVLVRQHLSSEGVLAINVGRTAQNFELVDSLAATVAQVFPSVHLIDEPAPSADLGNSLLIATVQETHLKNLVANVNGLPSETPAEWQDFAQRAVSQARTASPAAEAIPFTDDRAPVEQVVHRVVLSFLLHSRGAGSE